MSNYGYEPQIQPRSPYARPGPIPDIRLEGFLEERTPSLIPRDSSSTISSSTATKTSCGPKDTTGPCERSASSRDNTTLPITLGVVIPLAAAFIVMIVLHRRNMKKQRREDAEDRVKSLDFGLGPGAKKPGKAKKGAKGPEMSATDAVNAVRKERGLSLDMTGPNPFLLPPGLQHSRESLHSLSRSFNTGDDKYARTNFIPDDGSIRSPSNLRRHGDDSSSSFTGSSRPRFDYESSKTLVQSSTKSGPPTRKASLSAGQDPVPDMGLQRKPTAPLKDNLLVPNGVDSRDSYVSTASNNGVAAFRKSNDYLGAFIRGGGLGFGNDDKSKRESKPNVAEAQPTPPKEAIQPPPVVSSKRQERPDQHNAVSHEQPSTQHQGLPSNPRPFHRQEPQPPQLSLPDFSDLKYSPAPEIAVTQHNERQTTPSAAPMQHPQSYPKHDSEFYGHESSYYGQQPNSKNETRENSYYDQQSDTQNQTRENSYYNQQPDSQSQTRENSYYSQQHYERDQDDQHYEQSRVPQAQNQEYDDGEDYYDPAEEYGDYDGYVDQLGKDARRQTMGMRPLPPDDPSENPEQRANRIRSFYKEYFDAPNGAHAQGYYDGSEHYNDSHYQDGYYPPRGHSSTGARHRGHTFSNGSYAPGPRAFSSASARYGHPHGRPGPKKPMKKMAPPKALNVLPTPSKLKDDTFLLDQAVDFAPPQRAYLQRSGTPESLRGGQRPYSPSVKSHIPLASSFDDLSAMPSPHQLRKSSTFTALDFAPPAPRYRGQETSSDSGSIRSNRSGVSALHQYNIRAGAYRISRIPKEMAGTKDDLNQALRPTWNMNR